MPDDTPPRWRRFAGTGIVLLVFGGLLRLGLMEWQRPQVLEFHPGPTNSPLKPHQPTPQRIERFDPTIEDLKELARQAPPILALKLAGDALTAEHLAALAACERLRMLDLTGAELGDDDIAPLVDVESLQSLHLAETLITDEAVAMLERLPQLAYADVSFTDVTRERIEAWRQAKPDMLIRTEKDDEPDGLLGSIRWADGRRGGNFRSFYMIYYNAPRDGEDHTHHRLTGQLRRQVLFWPASFWEYGNGPYEFRLSLGNFTSEPVVVTLTDGHPTPATIEFQMPTTKAEALKSKMQ